MEYFLQALRKYADFSGRARRKEYWMFVLFQVLAFIAAMVIDTIFATITGSEFGAGYITGLLWLALIVPGIAVSVRRMHDLDKSGWFLLVSFIPLVGGIWLLVLTCTEGTSGPNQYGPDPKGSALAI
ncbi:DUF805 domain-containing protein [Hymenobacter chitinivorans]|uniref:Uncharacterized membrane protein YhaH (DUF805 family) n=1 Tax=Hymenobacter chitinivorans DSM 11115 TaxID=1121954 RepID=A0A2M9B5Q4_9BACT|nr:DUF805 domain-containing protein [Hymenobacter chitinivorans]PJJ53275.1 uncharacterized membrane protein YhaH (DUF805 family) [Hymenobacter chitinivorans DSM 11115]